MFVDAGGLECFAHRSFIHSSNLLFTQGMGSASDDDMDDSPSQQHSAPTSRAVVVRSLLDPFGYPMEHPQQHQPQHTESPPPCNSETRKGAVRNVVTVLIPELAAKLAQEEQQAAATDGGGDMTTSSSEAEAAEEEDILRTRPPSQDAIRRFTDGMRTATEFLRLPNTVSVVLLLLWPFLLDAASPANRPFITLTHPSIHPSLLSPYAVLQESVPNDFHFERSTGGYDACLGSHDESLSYACTANRPIRQTCPW